MGTKSILYNSNKFGLRLEQINNIKSLLSLIGFYNFETAFQKRGNWLGRASAFDIKLITTFQI